MDKGDLTPWPWVVQAFASPSRRWDGHGGESVHAGRQRREGREGGGERSLYGQGGGGRFDGLPVPVCGQGINKIVKMKEKGMPLALAARRAGS